MDYLLSLVVTFELYLILALSLNLLIGYTGLVSLCHAAFYGLGAYTAGLLLNAGWGFLPASAAGVGVALLAGAAVALPSLRLRDDYFVVATIAFGAIVYRLLFNLELTGGAHGLSGIPPIQVAGASLPPESPWFVLLSTAATAVTVAVLATLMTSPFGRALRALRDDDQAAAALGHSVAALRVKAALAASACAAVAGALLAARQGTLDPNQFTIAESVLILTALIVGGSGNWVGPIVGAAVVVLLPEPLRLIGTSWAAAVGELRQIAFGAALILLLRWRPQGLAGAYRFE